MSGSCYRPGGRRAGASSVPGLRSGHLEGAAAGARRTDRPRLHGVEFWEGLAYASTWLTSGRPSTHNRRTTQASNPVETYALSPTGAVKCWRILRQKGRNRQQSPDSGEAASGGHSGRGVREAGVPAERIRQQDRDGLAKSHVLRLPFPVSFEIEEMEQSDSARKRI